MGGAKTDLNFMEKVVDWFLDFNGLSTAPGHLRMENVMCDV